MSDMRDMRYTTETISRETVMAYTDKRYGGMSDDVVFARLTIAYRFDGFEVVVKAIPAKWDRKTGVEYISGRVGRQVYDHVERVASSLLRQRGYDIPSESATEYARKLDQYERDLAALAKIIGDAPKSVSITPDLAA